MKMLKRSASRPSGGYVAESEPPLASGTNQHDESSRISKNALPNDFAIKSSKTTRNESADVRHAISFPFQPPLLPRP